MGYYVFHDLAMRLGGCWELHKFIRNALFWRVPAMTQGILMELVGLSLIRMPPSVKWNQEAVSTVVGTKESAGPQNRTEFLWRG